MLTANKLEKIIELEETLRAEYQAKLDALAAELAQSREQMAAQREEMQATIKQQLETITELSGKAESNNRVEQLNRELSNRSEKLQDEASDLKKRVKSLQKDLAEVREENKTLKQYDPARMKKNLDANKKKLADKTRAADALQKSLNQARGENAELERKVKELEEKLAETDSAESPQEEAA